MSAVYAGYSGKVPKKDSLRTILIEIGGYLIFSPEQQRYHFARLVLQSYPFGCIIVDGGGRIITSFGNTILTLWWQKR